MTDWPLLEPLLECLEHKEEFIEKLKKKGLVKRDWKPPKKRKGVINGYISKGNTNHR